MLPCSRCLTLAASVAFTFLLTLNAVSQVNVTTYHNDNSRTGQNTAETVLTTANVNTNTFRKLFTTTVDGQVYAQPLVLSKLSIGGGTHNVVYVATENDSVYAIDDTTGAIYWKRSFISPPSITTVPSSDFGCQNISPQYGITSTPVIDPVGGTLYVVAKTKQSGLYYLTLHAIDVKTGADKVKTGGTVITTTAGGVAFDSEDQETRPALLLENGHVIIASGGHCDFSGYYGYVFSYSASTLSQESALNLVPLGTDGKNGGIWMSGSGVAADSSGNLYFATGNGLYDAGSNTPLDYGDSIVKLKPPSGGTFPVADWFTPYNQSTLDGGDYDVGAGGVLLLPDLPSGSQHQQLLVQMGKGDPSQGHSPIYVVDRNNMSHYNSGGDKIVQEIGDASNGVWGSPAYWNGYLYWGAAYDGGSGDNLKAFSFNTTTGAVSTLPTSKTSQVFSFPGPSPSVSSNGTTNGIVWALENSSFNNPSCCAVLHAYQATNLATELYNSNMVSYRDGLGGAVKFTVPTVANGKVFVGGNGQISGFGYVAAVSCSVSESCQPPYGGIVTATITLSCSASSPISASATACGYSCYQNNGSITGTTLTVSSQASDWSGGPYSCSYSYCYNGICH